VPLYNSWKKSRRRTGKLAAGDTVVALTGVVITFRPGRVRVDRDVPDERGLKRGDSVLTYAYHGEGETTAWYKGHSDGSFDMTFATYPDGSGCARDCFGTVVDQGRREWWAQVKLRSGRTAWVLMDEAKFSGVDYSGDAGLPSGRSDDGAVRSGRS
jgi:hypothetical protein